MEKNRLFIIISAAVAILGTFLPWYTTVFGVISISGIQNSGWIVIVLSIGSIVLSCLNNINTPLNKTFQLSSLLQVLFLHWFHCSQPSMEVSLPLS